MLETPNTSENTEMGSGTNQMDFFGAADAEAVNFRLLGGDRRLAPSWRQRAADNVIAIRIMQECEAQGRRPSDAEMVKLIKFIGFGASEIANGLFEEGGYRHGYEPIGKSLDKMVSPTDRAALVRSTQYAHYTPEYIVRAMWKGLRQMGFTGGAILEPGCGTGLFLALMPEGIASRSSVLGIERDPITAKIATLLYPESDIQEADFTKAIVPPGFDLAIGNPPFSRLTVSADDPAGKLNLSLHDYFIARSIERLRPGGIAAFVVSRYFMDKGQRTARKFIAERADLLGAIRMPEAAMRADAGTDVVVDIVFFQRRADGAPMPIDDEPVWVADEDGEPMAVAGLPRWVFVEPSDLDIEGKPVMVNQWFLDHPNTVLGEHALTTSQFGPTYTCKHKGGDLDLLLLGAIAALPSGIYQPASLDRKPDVEEARALPSVRVGRADEGARIKEGSYFVDTSERDARAAKLYERADRESGPERKRLLREAAAAARERGTLYQIVDGGPQLIEVKSGRGTVGMFPSHAQIVCDLIPIREAIRDVLRAQVADGDWKPAQAALNKAYDTFVAAHGPINTTVIGKSVNPKTGEEKETFRYPNLAPFSDDPDCYLVASVENYDQDSNTASKGPIFTQRVLCPPPEVAITSASDALAVTLNENGCVVLGRIAELLSVNEGEAINLLGDTVYLDPADNEWKPADEYLSGKVRRKLERARQAAVTDPQFARNVAALEACQPVDLVPSDITVRLGTPWLPADVVAGFCAEKLGVEGFKPDPKTGKSQFKVTHTPEIGLWSVPVAAFESLASSVLEWGTKRRHAGLILMDALSGAIPTIWDTFTDLNGTEHRQVNPTETQAAKDKLAAMHEAFSAWVWTDAERTDRLCDIYNREWNDTVSRQFNGDHLLLPGASSAVVMRPHQKRAIWRMIVDGGTYLAHAVGAGKTLEVVAACMEQKRLGLISKPMIVVPGHTLNQWSREFLMLYPNAKILVADEDNFAKDKRQRFVARAAVCDWDAIIITHSAFKFLSVPKAFEEELLEQQLQVFVSLSKEIDKSDRLSVKKVEAQKEGLVKRLEALKSVKDDMLTLEEMGVDQIAYDEAQEARKLSFMTSSTNLKGVDPNGSQRAWDLYVKSKFLAVKRPGRALILASGTPITNTMGEMYTLLRFMNEEALVEHHIQHFDAWAGAFGMTNTELELQPSGNYKPVTRFSKFINIPELTSMFHDVADVVLPEDLRKYINLPRIRGGERKVLTYSAGPAFKEYQKLLAGRITCLENRRRKPEKGDDIILSVINDGRHAAIDLRMVNPYHDAGRIEQAGETNFFDPSILNWELLDECRNCNYENKLNGLIDNVFSIWRKTADYQYRDPTTGDFFPLKGAAQMVFSDLGTEAQIETRGFSAYTEIVRRLVHLGVPRNQIAIMQHYKKAAQKLRLFADVNAGRVRILIGSSKTMGTGVNAQMRLIALHHLDVPWLPSDVEQREGRIIRQGNQNDEVQIYAYATLGSVDATMWQTVERKARFIDAVLRGDKSVRTLEDLEADQASQFSMAKALSSGDDRLMRKAGLEADIARMQRKRQAHYDAQASIRRQVITLRSEIDLRTQAAARYDADILCASIPSEDDFSMVVEGETFTDAKQAAEAVMKVLHTAETECREKRWILGEYAGFQLVARGGFVLSFQKGRRDYNLRVDLMLESGEEQVYRTGEYRTGQTFFHRCNDEIGELEERRQANERALDKSKSMLADFSSKRTDVPFDQQAELDAMIGSLHEIEIDLARSETEEAKPAPAISHAPVDEIERISQGEDATV